LSQDGAKTVVLGVDEVNHLYDEDPKLLHNLFDILGSLSCSKKMFICPVIAGTCVRATTKIKAESSYLPIPIGLPFLSNNSVLNIFKSELPQYHEIFETPQAKKYLAILGGHPRVIEMFMESLKQHLPFKAGNFWKLSLAQTAIAVRRAYPIENCPGFDRVIALSFLSPKVNRTDLVDPKIPNSNTFGYFEDIGLIILEESEIADKLKVPYFFIYFWFNSRYRPTYYSLWQHFQTPTNFQSSWEVICQDYLIFKFALYSYLQFHSIKLFELFKGSKFNANTKNLEILVPSKVQRVTKKILDSDAIEVENVYMTVEGADCTAFALLKSTNGLNVLFKIKFITALDHQETISNELIEKEYAIARISFDKYRKRQTIDTFIFVLLDQGTGDFDASKLSENCFVVSKSVKDDFFGDAFSRLMNL
jgi:hypothetical protein